MNRKGVTLFSLIILKALPFHFASGNQLGEPDRSEFQIPSSKTEDTLFTKLSSEETGIEIQNPYDDPQMWGRRYREYMGGGMGSGVAAGDFDMDGNVDLYVSTKTKPGRLFRNLGNWKFVDVTEQAGLSEESSLLSEGLGWLKDKISSEDAIVWRQGAVFADVDNDGLLDLYVCRNDAPNFLYMNQGDGTFREEAEKRGLDLVDGSVVGAFSDYDRDGLLDVFVLTNQVDGNEPDGRADHLYHNDGNGYFSEITGASGISGETFGHAATWFDYDGDAWPDLYIANDFAGADYLYHNNGDGTFTNTINSAFPHMPYSSMGADTGDINNDGHIDLFIADMATTTREKDQRGLAASRANIRLKGSKNGHAPQFTRNALLLNTGKGVFREAATWAGIEATDWTWSVRFEDFDNDGWTDLHVTNGMLREANNSDLTTRMMRALSDSQRIGVIKRSPVLEESNLAYRNLKGEGFAPVTNAWGLGETGVTFGAATADLDNDGDLDLVYLNYEGGLSVYRNDILNQHRIQVRLHGKQSNHFGVGAIVRIESSSGLQSKTITVARGYASGSELVAHFGLGSDTEIKNLVVEWPSGIKQTFVSLAADYSYLIEENGTVSNNREKTIPSIYKVDTKAFGIQHTDNSKTEKQDKEQTFIPFRTDRRGPGIAVADIDGDEDEDIYIGATTGSPARILRKTNGAYLEESPNGIPASQVEDGPPLFLDVDANGTRDLLVTKASSNINAWPNAFEPIIYSNDGNGNFSPTNWLPQLALNVGAVCAADIDGDGDLDLFLGGRSIPGHYPETPRSALLRYENGHYVDATDKAPSLANVGLVKSALFRDVDLDGKQDLILALEWDYVRYFHNDGDGAFSDWTDKSGFNSGGRGWWNSLASADLNGDGRPDFAAGNLGLNTTYQATPEQPARLYYGDFAQNGTKLIAEAVQDGDTLYPLRSRSNIKTRLPHVLRQFPRNDDYAKANMTEVFGAKELAAAKLYTADQFESGAFLSQPDGSYRFIPFPRYAQMGPIHGIVTLDMDGDGLPDICGIQNADIASPSFHGGVGIFLKGSGDGSFDALEPEVSGIVVPGNARALVVIATNENTRPDLFLTRQGGQSELLVNKSPEAHWLKLRLKGTKNNPDAIGARVSVELSDGNVNHYEIGLGGGWFSQSAPYIIAAVPLNKNVVNASVKWPDGQVTQHTPPSDHGIWEINR